MRILICDDDARDFRELVESVESYSAERPELQLELNCFRDPTEALINIDEQGAPDLALLDICMPKLLGTDIARELQLRNATDTKLIFLSASEEFQLEAWACHAEGYLKKPYTAEGLAAVLDHVLEERQEHSCMLIPCRGEEQGIDLKTVLYGEKRGEELVLHLSSGLQRVSLLSMAGLMELIQDQSGYAMLGTSYLVNLRFIQNLRRTVLVMANGDQLPVPRRLRETVKKQYFDFYREEAMRL